MKAILRALLPALTIFLLTTSCSGAKPQVIYELASATEFKVTVSITLTPTSDGQALLSATFTPQEPSLHLYSKDIPKTGLDGLGRPTLLELAKNSPLQAIGKLTASVAPEAPISPPYELLVYPAGSITLTQQVQLPEGNEWLDDQVMVTYMACDDTGCRPPVQEKPIAIKIPARGVLQ